MEIVRAGLPCLARELSHWPISQRIRSSAVHTGVGCPHFSQNAWMGVLAPHEEQTKRLRATVPPRNKTRYARPHHGTRWSVLTISSDAHRPCLNFFTANRLPDLGLPRSLRRFAGCENRPAGPGSPGYARSIVGNSIGVVVPARSIEAAALRAEAARAATGTPL